MATTLEQIPSPVTPTAAQEIPAEALSIKAALIQAIQSNLGAAHNAVRSMGPLFAEGIRLVSNLIRLPGVTNKDIAEALSGDVPSLPGISLVVQGPKAGGETRIGSPYTVTDPVEGRGSKQFATPYRFLGRVEAEQVEKKDRPEGWAMIRERGVTINGTTYRRPSEALDNRETLTSVYRAFKNILRPTVHELVTWSDSQAKACEASAAKFQVVIRCYDANLNREHLKKLTVADDGRLFKHSIMGLIKAARGKFQLTPKAAEMLAAALLTLTEAVDDDDENAETN